MNRMAEESAKGTGGRSALLARAAGGAEQCDIGPPTPPPEPADPAEVPIVKTGGTGWGVKGAASITDKKRASAATGAEKKSRSTAPARPGSASAARAEARANRTKTGGAASTSSAAKTSTTGVVKVRAPKVVRGGRAVEAQSSIEAPAEDMGYARGEDEGGDDQGGFFVCETGAGSWS